MELSGSRTPVFESTTRPRAAGPPPVTELRIDLGIPVACQKVRRWIHAYDSLSRPFNTNAVILFAKPLEFLVGKWGKERKRLRGRKRPVGNY